jgi:hypothetical protein
MTSPVGTPSSVRANVSPLRRGLVAALLLSVAACSSSPESPPSGSPGTSQDAGAALADEADASAASAPGPHDRNPALADAAVVIEVPADASVCGANLPFKPPGCACSSGESAPCWTGPADQRYLGKCKDGVQKCSAAQEFGVWGACEGEVLDCGEPPKDPPVEEECKCIPGTVVGCDEDCTAFVFCAPFSTKVCQPDGKFGPCRESLLPTLESNAKLCLNVFHGCLPGNFEGVWVGDCNSPFTCGHPPGTPPSTPPTTTEPPK